MLVWVVVKYCYHPQIHPLKYLNMEMMGVLYLIHALLQHHVMLGW